RDAHGAVRRLIAPRRGALERERLLLERKQMRLEALALRGEHVFGAAPLEEARTERVLHDAEAARDRRLIHAERARGARERPMTFDGEHDAQVAPLEGHAGLHGAYAKLLRDRVKSAWQVWGHVGHVKRCRRFSLLLGFAFWGAFRARGDRRRVGERFP